MRESIIMDTSPCIVLATSGMLNGGPNVLFPTLGLRKQEFSCFVGYRRRNLGSKIAKGFSEVPMIIEGKTEMSKLVVNFN